MKDLDLAWNLDNVKAAKYKMYALNKDYYGNSPTEVFNQYMPEYHNKILSEGCISSYKCTIQDSEEYRVYYQVKVVLPDNTNYKSNEFIVVNKNSYHDSNYAILISN